MLILLTGNIGEQLFLLSTNCSVHDIFEQRYSGLQCFDFRFKMSHGTICVLLLVMTFLFVTDVSDGRRKSTKHPSLRHNVPGRVHGRFPVISPANAYRRSFPTGKDLLFCAMNLVSAFNEYYIKICMYTKWGFTYCPAICFISLERMCICRLRKLAGPKARVRLNLVSGLTLLALYRPDGVFRFSGRHLLRILENSILQLPFSTNL